MDLILIFFVFPLVTIILSAVLEFIIKCPIAVTAVAFSIWLLVAFLVFNTTTFFVAVFIYTLLAFITAIVVKFIRCNTKCKSCECFNIREMATAGIQDTITEAVNDAVNEVVPEAVNEAINNLLAATCGCGCNNNSNNNLGCGCNNNSNNNLGCGCNNNSNNNSGCGRSKTYRFKR